jgi:hypothetical protein
VFVRPRLDYSPRPPMIVKNGWILGVQMVK